jgi:tetratricopeptide (TPR) repeat protein
VSGTGLALAHVKYINSRNMPRMLSIALLLFLAAPFLGAQSSPNNADFNLALPEHSGQLSWHADGFQIVESSVKSNKQEIGIRGTNVKAGLTFLGFLFLPPANESPLDGAKCRDGAMEESKKFARSLRITSTSAIERADVPSVALAIYTSADDKNKPVYSVRGFTAKGDLCGDLEVYSPNPVTEEDPLVSSIFNSFRLNPDYTPQFADVLLFAQMLFERHDYRTAAPLFEKALSEAPKDASGATMRRVLTDQAGMSYGISGNIGKAREIFQAAITSDPDYPMYYYNLACADAEEHKLSDARAHLQQAFDRKQNMISGETIPDPSRDDSFLPYKNDKEFWKFVVSLH